MFSQPSPTKFIFLPVTVLAILLSLRSVGFPIFFQVWVFMIEMSESESSCIFTFLFWIFCIKVFPDILFLIIDLGNFNSTLFNFFTARYFMSLSVAVSTNFVLVRAVLVPVELSASIACARRVFFHGLYLYLRGGLPISSWQWGIFSIMVFICTCGGLPNSSDVCYACFFNFLWVLLYINMLLAIICQLLKRHILFIL